MASQCRSVTQVLRFAQDDRANDDKTRLVQPWLPKRGKAHLPLLGQRLLPRQLPQNQMPLPEMHFRSLAPRLHEPVIQPRADRRTGQRNHAGRPFLHDLRTGLRRDPLNHLRHKLVDDFFLQKLAADVDSSGAVPAKFGPGSDLRGTVAYYNSSAALLNKSLLADHDEIISAIRAPNNVPTFENACQKLRDFLFQGGLNLYDTYAFAYEVLSDVGRDTLSKPEYANSACFADRSTFNDIGRPLLGLQRTCSPGYTASKQFLDNVGLYWTKNDVADLGAASGCLSNSVAILDMRGQTTVDFSNITARSGAASIEYLHTLIQPSGSHPFGCYSGSIGGDTDARKVWFVVQTAGNKRYHVELSGDAVDPDGPMNKILIKDASAQEAACSSIKS